MLHTDMVMTIYIICVRVRRFHALLSKKNQRRKSTMGVYGFPGRYIKIIFIPYFSDGSRIDRDMGDSGSDNAH